METQYRDSLPDDVRSAFEKAVEALPPEYHRAPVTGDEVSSLEEALRCFQNYAFTQGFALVISSKARERLRAECIHHGNKHGTQES